MPGLTTEDYLSGASISRDKYGDLTGGRGPAFDEFQARTQDLLDLAKLGEVERVTAEVRALINDFADDGPVTDMSDELLKMLLTLGQLATKTADTEAIFNGDGREEFLDKEMSALGDKYRQQAELASTIAQHGENSAEVEAVRNRHAREALTLRLRQLGVEEDSAREREALAALETAQAAEMEARAQSRERSISQSLTGLSNELAVTQAIIEHGETGAEVERLRTEHARESLRLRLLELGATEDQIQKAEELLEKERQAARQVTVDKAEKDAANSLEGLQREARINEAILRYGRDSLEVKRLQIEAARAEYIQSLATLQVAQATKDALLAQWDATNGAASADPFGTLAAAKSILDTQAQSIAQLQLEQALIGQSEETRRRVLALYEAELEIRQRGIDAEGELAARIREGALAESDLAASVARQTEAWEDVTSTAESAIDRMVDAAMDADLPGVFEGIAEEIQTLFTDLAIKNPLKNAILGTDNTTLADLGGLGGIWDRLTGKTPDIDPAAAAAQAAAQSVATMQVTASSVIIGGAGVSQFLSGAAGAGAGMSPANLPDSPVAGQIWEFFKGKGLAPHQIAAIVGNVAGESGFDPRAVGDGGTSFGLFQHHASRGEGLLASVGGMGGLGNVQGQLDYVWKELLSSESGVLQKLLATTNVQDATSVWMRDFERPSQDAMMQS